MSEPNPLVDQVMDIILAEPLPIHFDALRARLPQKVKVVTLRVVLGRLTGEGRIAYESPNLYARPDFKRGEPLSTWTLMSMERAAKDIAKGKA